MTDHPIHDLSDDVHQRVRLGILASLTGLARADFTSLRDSLSLSDGNLGRHLEVLERAQLVTLTRESDTGRPRTWVSITRTGRSALRREIHALRRIMEQAEGQTTPSGSQQSPLKSPTRRSTT